MIQILAISGSLRKLSSNTTLIRAAAALAPLGVSVTLFEGLGDLPHFNPDLEGMEEPSVHDFRGRLQLSQGVLISSPEYAHGVPGSMKNALDWLVGSGELVNKPVALLNASPYSTFAQASLRETLTVMSARIVDEACVTVPQQIRNLDESALLSHTEISSALRASLAAFVSAIQDGRYESTA